MEVKPQHHEAGASSGRSLLSNGFDSVPHEDLPDARPGALRDPPRGGASRGGLVSGAAGARGGLASPKTAMPADRPTPDSVRPPSQQWSLLVCSNGKTIAKVHVSANSSVSDLRDAVAASLNGDIVNFASADFKDEALLRDLGLHDASSVELLPPPRSPAPPLILDHPEPEAMATDKPSKPPGGLVKTQRERRDRNGTPIRRGQTRHKTSFADHIVGRDALAEVKEVPYIYDSSGRGCSCSIM